MAKALLGYMSSADPRVVSQLTAENRRLKQMVIDLEAQERDPAGASEIPGPGPAAPPPVTPHPNGSTNGARRLEQP